MTSHNDMHSQRRVKKTTENPDATRIQLYDDWWIIFVNSNIKGQFYLN